MTLKGLICRLQGRPQIIYTKEEWMQDVAYPIIATKWHDQDILVKVRELTSTQLWGIGNLSLIETFADKIAMKKEPTIQEFNAYAERHHKICRLALVSPTYDQLMQAAGAHIDQTAIDKELDRIKELWKACPAGDEKRQLQKEYDSTELASRFILPMAFTAPIVEYVTGAKRTEIKGLTEDMLLKAAILASRGGDNPADHLSGNFVRFEGDKFLLDDINNRAWILLDEHTDKQRKATNK